MTEHQQFLLSHLSHFAPGHVAGQMRRPTPYRSTANLLIQTALTGGASSPLPARQALLEDLEAVWEAGLRQLRYSWIVLPGGRLLLDLMNGCYLWLVPAADGAVAAADATATASGGDDDNNDYYPGSNDADDHVGIVSDGKEMNGMTSTTISNKSEGGIEGDDSSSSSSGSSSGSSGNGSGVEKIRLDADQLYHILVQRPDGSMVYVSAGARKPRDIFQLPNFHTAEPEIAADTNTTSSSSSSSDSKEGSSSGGSDDGSSGSDGGDRSANGSGSGSDGRDSDGIGGGGGDAGIGSAGHDGINGSSMVDGINSSSGNGTGGDVGIGGDGYIGDNISSTADSSSSSHSYRAAGTRSSRADRGGVNVPTPAPPPSPLPLHIAAVRAEAMVQRWAVQKLVLVSRAHQMRVTGMLGGWSVPSKAAGTLNSIAAGKEGRGCVLLVGAQGAGFNWAGLRVS